METHRVLHDFGELNYEELNEIAAAHHNKENIFQARPYPLLLAALAFGLLIGYFARRN